MGITTEAFGSDVSAGVDWGRTVDMHRRLQGDSRYEEPFDGSPAPEGHFAGRPIIASDTPINGGVYLGGGRREAIVVDDEKFPEALGRVYHNALSTIYDIAKDPESYPGDYFYGVGHSIHTSTLGIRERVLVPVFSAVLDALPYSDQVVRDVSAGHGNDGKVSINQFIEGGGGVCRHQGLLAAYILERLQKEAELVPEDKISIDRNGVIGKGAHGWARFTSSDGTVYVVDPAQKFVGTLEHAQRLYRWPYARPEDKISG